jgi:tRNA G37 N-methylase TrmD
VTKWFLLLEELKLAVLWRVVLVSVLGRMLKCRDIRVLCHQEILVFLDLRNSGIDERRYQFDRYFDHGDVGVGGEKGFKHE